MLLLKEQTVVTIPLLPLLGRFFSPIRSSLILRPSVVFSDNYRGEPFENGLTFNHRRLSEVPL